MEFETSVEISAGKQRVWDVLSDVEQWSTWTPTITRIQLLDRPLSVGARADVGQPRLRPATYTVTDCREGEAFSWAMSMPGVTVLASHEITGPDQGPVTVRLGIKQTGWLSPMVSLMYGRLSRQYVLTEATELKKACESA